MGKKTIRGILVVLGIIFIIAWNIKIIENIKSNKNETIVYEAGQTMLFQDLEISVRNANLYQVDQFLKCYGQQYADNYTDEFLSYMNGTKILVCKLFVKNISDSEYDLSVLFGAYARMEHRWISAFDPMTAQSLNEIFLKKNNPGYLKPGEETMLTLVTDINHITLTDTTWNNLTNKQYVFCLAEKREGFKCYELIFFVEGE